MPLRRASGEGDSQNEDMLQDVDPVGNREARRQLEEEDQLDQRDAEQDDVAVASPNKRERDDDQIALSAFKRSRSAAPSESKSL